MKHLRKIFEESEDSVSLFILENISDQVYDFSAKRADVTLSHFIELLAMVDISAERLENRIIEYIHAHYANNKINPFRSLIGNLGLEISRDEMIQTLEEENVHFVSDFVSKNSVGEMFSKSGIETRQYAFAL